MVAPYRLPVFDQLAKHHDVTVLFYQGEKDFREWDIELNEKYDFDYEILKSKQIGPFVVNSGLTKYLRQTDFDLYILNDSDENILQNIKISAYAKLASKPTVWWFEAISPNYKPPSENKLLKLGKRTVLTRYRQAMLNISDSVIAFSQKSSNFARELGVNEPKVVESSQHMPEEQISSATKQSDKRDVLNKSKRIFLYIGQIDPRKGIETLIDSYMNISNGETSLIIAGSGVKSELVEKISEQESDIHYLGYVNETEKARLYEHSDIFVLPTRHDPWGLVINEALHFGLPVITTQAAGASELVKENGIVIDAVEVDTLSAAMKRMIDDDNYLNYQPTNNRDDITDTSIMVSDLMDAIGIAIESD
ncbi:glycosyltransferase family 4 protein [Haloferax chudinovii]|uniref:Glycosyltransferase family 4 protein n=1 Tax=Haloferax chudinovii TaxID=1109010 RepID=A0ABD5XSD7_9EURY